MGSWYGEIILIAISFVPSTVQEDPDIIEGDEEEVGLASSGPIGEELLRQQYLLRAMSTTQVAMETRRTPSAQSGK